MAQNPAAYITNVDPTHRAGGDSSTRDSVGYAISYQPTPEEQRVLHDCQTESFRYAALPGSVVAGTAMGLLAKSGTYFKATGRFGALPHIGAGMMIGFIGGKLSYISKCEDMLVTRAPNGAMAQAIRARREGKTFDMPHSQYAPHAEILGVGPAARTALGRGGSAGDMSVDTSKFGWSGSTASPSLSDLSTKKSQSTSQYQSPANEEYMSAIDVDSEQSSARNEVEDYSASNYNFDKAPQQQKPLLGGSLGGSSTAPSSSHSYEELRKYNRDAYYHPQQQAGGPTSAPGTNAVDRNDIARGERAPSTFEMLTRGSDDSTASPVSGNSGDTLPPQRSTRAGGPRRVNQYGDPILD